MMNKLKIILGVGLTVVLYACNGQSLQVENLSVDAFEEIIKEGGVILDVRTPQEVSKGHIPNASTINFYDADFAQKAQLIQKDKAVYVYCRSGGRSAKAARILSQQGQAKVYNLLGGFGAWQSAGNKIETPSNIKDEHIQSLSVADFQEVLTANGLVLADFHTQWCVPCRKMVPIIDNLERSFSEKAKILRIDMDASSELAKEFQILAVPTFVLFKDGKEKWRKSGVLSEEALREVILKHVQ